MHRNRTDRASKLGEEALGRGRVAVVTLAAGVGSRWTTGAGVVKAINPFVNLDGRHRSFLEIHLAKTGAIDAAIRFDGASYRHDQLPHARGHSSATWIDRTTTATTGPSSSRAGQSIGQRLIPMAAT